MPNPTNVSVHMCSHCQLDPTELPSTEPAQSADPSAYGLATTLFEQSADEFTLYVMPHRPDCPWLGQVVQVRKPANRLYSPRNEISDRWYPR